MYLLPITRKFVKLFRNPFLIADYLLFQLSFYEKIKAGSVSALGNAHL